MYICMHLYITCTFMYISYLYIRAHVVCKDGYTFSNKHITGGIPADALTSALGCRLVLQHQELLILDQPAMLRAKRSACHNQLLGLKGPCRGPSEGPNAVSMQLARTQHGGSKSPYCSAGIFHKPEATTAQAWVVPHLEMSLDMAVSSNWRPL